MLVGDEGGIAVDDQLCILQATKATNRPMPTLTALFRVMGDGIEDAFTDIGEGQHDEDDALYKDGHQANCQL